MPHKCFIGSNMSTTERAAIILFALKKCLTQITLLRSLG